MLNFGLDVRFELLESQSRAVFPIMLSESSWDVLSLTGENHGAHMWEFLLAKEHVLGAAESDAFGAKGPCLHRIAGNGRVGTAFHRPVRFSPFHEFAHL